MSLKDTLKSTGISALTGLADAVIEFGKSALHSVMPDDYEHYLCSFELYDSKQERIGFLSFVVMPDQITESHSPIQSITKTHSGIVTTFNKTFSPINITIAGTFGKKFRIVSNYKDPGSKLFTNVGGYFNFNLNIGSVLNIGSGLNVGLKSGYGLTKVLKNIIQLANNTDKYGKPHLLIFNNYAFNTSYVVNPMNFQFHQGYENNMIWHYSINMTAVGNKPRKVMRHMGELLGSVASNSISNGLTKVINNMIGF